MQERDAPTLLHSDSAINAKNNPEKPNQESCCGQYGQRDTNRKHWYDGPGRIGVSKCLEEIQADFTKRVDWMI